MALLRLLPFAALVTACALSGCGASRPAGRAPARHDAETMAQAGARGVAQETCTATRNGLREAIGAHISPSDTAAAPVIVARLQGLQRRTAEEPVDLPSATLGTALAKADRLAKEWGAVLIIGPGDKRRAARIGKRVIAAVGEVNTAAQAAGFGACAIPLN